jgi:hypothetical protein
MSKVYAINYLRQFEKSSLQHHIVAVAVCFGPCRQTPHILITRIVETSCGQRRIIFAYYNYSQPGSITRNSNCVYDFVLRLNSYEFNETGDTNLNM